MQSLKYLLVGEKPNRQTDTIEQALLESDCQTIESTFGFAALDEKVLRFQPDVLIIVAAHAAPQTLEAIRIIHEHFPVPVIIFAEEQKHDSSISNIINAGVSAYIVDGLQTSRIRTIVEIAIARFQHNLALKTELEQTRTRLEERKLVDRAKGILMKKRDLSEQAAYHTLRKLAMDRNTTLSEMAKNIISLADILTP